MFSITSCSYKKNYNSDFYCEKLEFNCVRDNQNIIFRTSNGNFEVELYGKTNPLTVTNFIENIKKGIYKDKNFYKIVNYPQIQVIHSGIFSKTFDYIKKNQNFEKTSLSIPLEIKIINESEPRYKSEINDPYEILNLENVFENGSLAMVKKGKSNSSSTEFFFITNKFPELDGRYSVFGKVVKGIEVLKTIVNKDYIYEVVLLD